MAIPASFLVVVDKPAGITSRDVVNRLMHWTGSRRVGHAGTLDPLATGVLVVAVERATRLIEYVQQCPKQYRATFLLGQTSNTDDIEGAVTQQLNSVQPTRDHLARTLQQFVGTILQVPPQFSALKVQGARAYERAREGATVSLAARPVTFHQIQLLQYQWPRVELLVECGSGTYIRALARDLGHQLGCGGLMSQLQRTRIGSFTLAAAVAWDQITAALQDWSAPAGKLGTATAIASRQALLQEHFAPYLLPLTAAIDHLPTLILTDKDLIRRFLQGQPICPDAQPTTTEATDDLVVSTTAGQLLGIARWQPDSQTCQLTKGGFAEPTDWL